MPPSKWQCLRSGQCCASVGHVTMTYEEQAVLAKRFPDLPWVGHPDVGFVRLKGSPGCPLLGYSEDGQALCEAHDIRPYNCRRWGCFRAGTEQRYDVAAVKHRINTIKDIRRQAKKLQEEAQPWAVEHGWKP